MSKQQKKMHNYSLVYSESTFEDKVNLNKRRIREISSKLFVLTDQTNQNSTLKQKLASQHKEEMDFYIKKSRQP